MTSTIKTLKLLAIYTIFRTWYVQSVFFLNWLWDSVKLRDIFFVRNSPSNFPLFESPTISHLTPLIFCDYWSLGLFILCTLGDKIERTEKLCVYSFMRFLHPNWQLYLHIRCVEDLVCDQYVNLVCDCEWFLFLYNSSDLQINLAQL